MLLFMMCMALFTMQVVPTIKWYQPFTYIVTWPMHLGEWVKVNFTKPVITIK